MSFFLQNNLLIIAIYTYILFYHIKDTDYTQMLLLTFITGFLICKNKNIETFDDDNDDDDDEFTVENTNATTYDGSPDYIKNLSNKSINDNDDEDTTNNLIERQSDIDIKAFNNIMRMGPSVQIEFHQVRKLCISRLVTMGIGKLTKLVRKILSTYYPSVTLS